MATSQQESVSCDACMKSNFSSLRFKCLVCYDYDLCASCRDCGATSSRHTVNHPMQCIMTRADLNMYYGGDSSSTLHTLSYTCSYCGQMGFSIALLLEHIRSSHGGNSGASATEVVCPICAVLPSGDPNHVTDDLAAHIALVHRLTATDFEEDQLTSIRHIRRLTHPMRTANLGSGGSASNTSGTAGSGGHASVSRANRGAAMMQLIELPSLPGAGLSSAGRDPMDPIAELLSQLSSVRSRALGGPHNVSHFSQLEMQLSSSRQHLERLPTRQQEPSARTPSVSTANPVASQTVTAADSSQAAAASKTSPSAGASSSSTASISSRSRFLLSRMAEKNVTEADHESREADLANRSLFVQEILLALMSESTDGVPPGISSGEQECWSSVEDLQLSDSDGSLSKSAHSPSASSQHGSISSLAGICNDADSSSVAVSRTAENCEPLGKDAFSVGVGAVGGLEVTCSRAGVL